MATHDFSVRCMCAMSCAVMFVGEWDDEDGGIYLDLYQHVRSQGGWRDRVRVAWAVLRGREPYTHGLMLDDDGVTALHDHLASVLSGAPTPEGGSDAGL